MLPTSAVSQKLQVTDAANRIHGLSMKLHLQYIKYLQCTHSGRILIKLPAYTMQCSRRSALCSEASPSLAIDSSDTAGEINVAAEVECADQSIPATGQPTTQPVELLPVSQTAAVQCQLIMPQMINTMHPRKQPVIQISKIP